MFINIYKFIILVFLLKYSILPINHGFVKSKDKCKLLISIIYRYKNSEFRDYYIDCNVLYIQSIYRFLNVMQVLTFINFEFM